jgi:hypothetical protein
MSTSVTNGGYDLKVKQVTTVEADQDVVIACGTPAPGRRACG